jgi:peptidoglycan/xylan/chitin deacetylase (PgdA/CDA1 family)
MVGKEQYLETLPLRDREIVLTFDDGPLPATTPRILDALAEHCARATFFMLGINVAESPALVRRAYDEGHTIGTHTFTHANLTKISLAQAEREVNLGIEAATEALGPLRQMAPFFRAPYLAINKDIERYVLSRRQMIWSIDADSIDYTFVSPERVIQQSLSELDRVRKGIFLMHDIKPATARAMGTLLAELKMRGFKLVHVVPATATQSALQPRQ